MVDATLIVSSIGLAVATIGGAIAFYNAQKGVLWKRAELANAHIKELTSNEELVFACRCIDWNGGKLIVPSNLRPLLEGETKVMEHDWGLLSDALDPDLSLDEMSEELRLQVYRTAIDSLLGWMSLVDSAIKRRLYKSEDVQDVRYWLMRIYDIENTKYFIEAFGYGDAMSHLARCFEFTPPSMSPPTTVSSRGGFGATGRRIGGSAGG